MAAGDTSVCAASFPDGRDGEGGATDRPSPSNIILEEQEEISF